MIAVPEDLRSRLRQYNQEHVLAWWDRISDDERRVLLEQLQELDLDLLTRLYRQGAQTFHLPAAEHIEPAPVIRLDPGNHNARERGEEALRRGEVAVLLVAG